MATPVIREYRQQISTPLGPDSPRARAPAIADVSGGTAALAQGLGQVAGALAQREQDHARAWAAEAMSKARLEWTTHLIERQNSAEPGAPEFTPSLLKDYDGYTDEILGKAPSDAARRFLKGRLADYKAQLAERALTFEAQARIDYKTDRFEAAIQNVSKLMNTDPGQYQEALAEQLALVDSAQLPPVKKSALRERIREKISEAAVWAQVQRSPEAFLQSVGLAPGPDGKMRTATNLQGVTGNPAFDNLDFDKRMAMVKGAMQMKNQIDSDAERAAKAREKELVDAGMKDAWDLQRSGKLTLSYIQSLRPIVSQDQYHSLLTALKSQNAGGEGPGDRQAIADIEQALINDPLGARELAFRYHRQGLIRSSYLTSVNDRSLTRARQGGPDTEYERVRNHINTKLSPGGMVQDPSGRARVADALLMFDQWVAEGQGKRTDAEIRQRGQEIVDQFAFLKLDETVLALPSPRSGTIRRQMNDPEGMRRDIYEAVKSAKRRLDSGEYSQSDYEQDLRIAARWERLVKEQEAQIGQRRTK